MASLMAGESVLRGVGESADTSTMPFDMFRDEHTCAFLKAGRGQSHVVGSAQEDHPEAWEDPNPVDQVPRELLLTEFRDRGDARFAEDKLAGPARHPLEPR